MQPEIIFYSYVEDLDKPVVQKCHFASKCLEEQRTLKTTLITPYGT